MALNPVHLSKIEWLMQQRHNEYARVRELRKYDRGDTPSLLSDDQKIQMVGESSAASGIPKSDPEVRLNVCATPNRVEADRLEIQDIMVTIPNQMDAKDSSVTVVDNKELSERLSKLVSTWWKRNRLDEGQQNAYYSGCRDGNSFGICHYDKDKMFPRVAIHQLYDGETSGADVLYVDGDPGQPIAGYKIWIAKDTESETIRRKNVYYDDRVEKWISSGVMSPTFADANWKPLQHGDENFTDDLVLIDSLSQPGETATVEWWTESGNERSEGMGLPVKHFRHDARGLDHGTSTIDLIVPSGQDAVNRATNNLQAGAVLAGFPANYIIGADRDETTWMVGPSQLLVVEDSSGSAGQFPAANLEQLIKVKDTGIKDTATLTSTPLTFYNLTGVIPAEGTLQSLEMALVAKVETDQVSFGNTWEDIFRLMIKMEKTWGKELAGVSDEILDTMEINAVWESAKVSNEKEETEIAAQHKALGVPDRFVFRMLGYTEDEIDLMLTAKDVKRGVVIGQLGEKVAAIEAQNAAGTVTVEAGSNGTNEPADQPTA